MNKNRNKEKIVIYGDSEFAEQVYYQLLSDGRYEVAAFTVDAKRFHKHSLHDLPVYSFQMLDNYLDKKDIKVFVAIGYTKMNTIRDKVTNEVVAKGYNLFTYISENAFIGQNVKIGDGCFISEFVSIKPGTIIKSGVVILPHTSIGHGVLIEKYCYLSICIAVGGFSVIESHSFLGMNSTIKNGITISAKNIIGSASNVVKSTVSEGVYVGNPAKRIKDGNVYTISI